MKGHVNRKPISQVRRTSRKSGMLTKLEILAFIRFVICLHTDLTSVIDENRTFKSRRASTHPRFFSFRTFFPQQARPAPRSRVVPVVLSTSGGNKYYRQEYEDYYEVKFSKQAPLRSRLGH